MIDLDRLLSAFFYLADHGLGVTGGEMVEFSLILTLFQIILC